MFLMFLYFFLARQRVARFSPERRCARTSLSPSLFLRISTMFIRTQSGRQAPLARTTPLKGAIRPRPPAPRSQKPHRQRSWLGIAKKSGEADAMWVYADQAQNCLTDPSEDCAGWEGFGTDYAYTFNGTNSVIVECPK